MPGMALQQGQPMLFEPVTWSTRDRVAYYRMDAARLRRMAETADCATARELLVDLARRYRRGAPPGGKQGPPLAPSPLRPPLARGVPATASPAQSVAARGPLRFRE